MFEIALETNSGIRHGEWLMNEKDRSDIDNAGCCEIKFGHYMQ